MTIRSKMLNIAEELISINTADKLKMLQQWSKQQTISLDEMAYIGDDSPDIEVLKAVGFSACPNDAIDEVKEVVDLVLTKDGGKGCVREFVNLLLK